VVNFTFCHMSLSRHWQGLQASLLCRLQISNSMDLIWLAVPPMAWRRASRRVLFAQAAEFFCGGSSIIDHQQ